MINDNMINKKLNKTLMSKILCLGDEVVVDSIINRSITWVNLVFDIGHEYRYDKDMTF